MDKFCDCWGDCGGGKRVSDRTYKRHEAARLSGNRSGAAQAHTSHRRGQRHQDAGQSNRRSHSPPPRQQPSTNNNMNQAQLGGTIDTRTPLQHADGFHTGTGTTGEDPLPEHDNQANQHSRAPTPMHEDDSDDDEDRADQGSLHDQRQRPLTPPPAQQLNQGDVIDKSDIEEIQTALDFIAALRATTLETTDMEPEDIQLLRNPAQYPVTIENADVLYGIRIFFSTVLASEDTYTQIRDAAMERHPTDEIPTYYQTREHIKNLSGVKPTTNDMCIQSCIGYTGPYENLDTCPKCLEARYDSHGKPRKTFSTIPIGPQIQAMYRDANSARLMKYRRNRTEELITALNNNADIDVYDDYISGHEYLAAVREGKILPDDNVLMCSLDGAQLYRSKTSDCWFFVWVFLDLDCNLRYKKRYVAPGAIIPGPNHPKNLDSFLFPGFQHLAAIQKEGLQIWDADTNRTYRSNIFFLFGTSDGPGLASLTGLNGYRGKMGCRLYCPIPGRRKPNGNTYYPVLAKPDNYTLQGCDHDDIDLLELSSNFTSSESRSVRYREKLQELIACRNQTQYLRVRRESGITKPSILDGLPANRHFDIIGMLVLDFMHIPALNVTDLLFGVWRGTIDCDSTDSKDDWDFAVLQGEVWKIHGAEVEACTPYLPGSFDRPPRNPAEKINSQFKAQEFINYVYGLVPALLYGILPLEFWKNICKLIAAVRILLQHQITPAQLLRAHILIMEFSKEFEELYCRRRIDRIHFVRQCLHALSHGAPETVRVGPTAIYSQWTIERTIGNLGEELRQHSNPYQNITQRAILRAQMNALQSMIPSLARTKTEFPRGSIDLGNSYVLLPATDSSKRDISDAENEALRVYTEKKSGRIICADQWPPQELVRWARLRLPNGQVARSQWKESRKPLEKLRISRNIKFRTSPTAPSQFGEVRYFTIIEEEDAPDDVVAIVSLYGDPNLELLNSSSGALISCKPLGDEAVVVINVKTIQSVIAAIPHPSNVRHPELEGCVFIMEKPGLDIAVMGGMEETLDDE